MANFIFNVVLWTLALYGFFEIAKTLIRTYYKPKNLSSGIYLFIAVKNQENKIEGFLRNFLFRIIYGKEENIKDIIIADLDSTDDTANILKRLEKEYKNIKVSNWKECKEIIESVKLTH